MEAALAAVDSWGDLPAQNRVDWYRLAEGFLGLRSDEEAFVTRFRENYRECIAAGEVGDAPDRVICSVGRRDVEGVVRVEFRGPPTPGDPEFPRNLLTLGRQPAPAGPAGWWLADTDHPVGRVGFSRDRVVVDLDGPWQAFVASMAVSRCLATQPGVLFFHAAAARVNGRGVLLLGVSGSGKTSVSLALASRGHAFFGDDIVGVRLESRELVPLRRAAHVREGPAAVSVRKALSGTRPAGEGSRVRADVGSLFPSAAAGPATLDCVVCLRRFADHTRVEPFRPKVDDVKWLTPHASALSSGPGGSRAMDIVSLVSASPCFFLDAASPESAADALERLTE